MATVAKKKLTIGDEVNVRLGGTTWRARVVEDRGRIGINGRQLYRVKLLSDDSVEQFVEVPVEDIELRQP
jgi:hypothetical protein